MKRLELWIAATFAGSALILAGCASTPAVTPAAPANPTTSPASTDPPSPTPTPDGTTPPAPTPQTPSASPSNPDVEVPPAAAEHNERALVAIVLAQTTTGGTPIDLEWKHNRWEIELVAGKRLHEVYVSADGETIIKQESERADAEERALVKRAKVRMAAAIATVVATAPEAKVVNADLDTRRGDVVWEIDTTTGTSRERTLVNAVTGAVI